MQTQLPPSVILSNGMPDYPFFEITHPKCVGRIALHGAHVTSWCPAGAKEVLYLSPDAVYREGKAIRGGIPICWPWFNAHPSDPSLPSHGIARSRFWEFLNASESEDGVTLCMEMRDGAWSANVTIFMGDYLHVSLESLNPTDFPQQISGALHTYIAVGDIEETEIQGLDDCAYLDTVGEKTMRRQNGPLFIDREVDRIYESENEVRVFDGKQERTIVIKKTGSPSTVVWNPWAEKSAALADMPDDGYLRFVCVEAAIANEKAITLMPSERHVVSTRIQLLEK